MVLKMFFFPGHFMERLENQCEVVKFPLGGAGNAAHHVTNNHRARIPRIPHNYLEEIRASQTGPVTQMRTSNEYTEKVD